MFNTIGLKTTESIPFSDLSAVVAQMIYATPARILFDGYNELNIIEFADRVDLLIHSPHTWGEDTARYCVWCDPRSANIPVGTLITIDMEVCPERFLGQLRFADQWDLLAMGESVRYHIACVMELTQRLLTLADMELTNLVLPVAFAHYEVLARPRSRVLMLSDLARVAKYIHDRIVAIGGNAPEMIYLTELQDGFGMSKSPSVFLQNSSELIFSMLHGEDVELPFPQKALA